MDGVLNNSYTDEETRCHLDACGKYHSLSCHYSDVPDSLTTPISEKGIFSYYSWQHHSYHCRHCQGDNRCRSLTQTATTAVSANFIFSKSADVLQAQDEHLCQSICLLQQIDLLTYWQNSWSCSEYVSIGLRTQASLTLSNPLPGIQQLQFYYLETKHKMCRWQ